MQKPCIFILYCYKLHSLISVTIKNLFIYLFPRLINFFKVLLISDPLVYLQTINARKIRNSIIDGENLEIAGLIYLFQIAFFNAINLKLFLNFIIYTYVQIFLQLVSYYGPQEKFAFKISFERLCFTLFKISKRFYEKFALFSLYFSVCKSENNFSVILL